MAALARLCLFIAAAAMAGSAAAQMPNMMGQGAMTGPAQPYPADPSSLTGPPSPSPDCLDRPSRPGPAPKVTRVMPAPGSAVRPGPMVLSVTFDRPMACRANLEASRFPLPCPDGKGAVMISPDRRTLMTVCVVQAGASYSMPLVDFVGEGGAKSERYDLEFTTSTEAPVRDARQAMALEKAGPAKR